MWKGKMSCLFATTDISASDNQGPAGAPTTPQPCQHHAAERERDPRAGLGKRLVDHLESRSRNRRVRRHEVDAKVELLARWHFHIIDVPTRSNAEKRVAPVVDP